jgi:hypothetical protein
VVPSVYEAAGVTKGPFYGLPAHRRRRGISIRKKDLNASRTRETMASIDSTPAARNWSIKLPVVGSIYISVLPAAG